MRRTFVGPTRHCMIGSPTCPSGASVLPTGGGPAFTFRSSTRGLGGHPRRHTSTGGRSSWTWCSPRNQRDASSAGPPRSTSPPRGTTWCRSGGCLSPCLELPTPERRSCAPARTSSACSNQRCILGRPRRWPSGQRARAVRRAGPAGPHRMPYLSAGAAAPPVRAPPTERLAASGTAPVGTRQV